MTAATNLEQRVARGTVYHVGGEGDPLLLVHGLGGGSGNWCEIVPELLERHRVIAVDLPGHAASAPLERGATVDDFAAAVAGALDAEGVAHTLVAGHSFGGLVALRLAHRRPELVRALLLVSPAGISTTSRLIEALVVASTTLRPGRTAARFRRRWAGRVWYRRALFRPWFVADADALGERATHGLLEAQAGHANTSVAGRAMVAGDPRRDLDLRCPALVLWGAQDAQLPLDDAFEYARRLRAPLRVVADCGHLVIVERPRAVLDALEALG
jgi:pyruvate dehydrogenase E2 component (dihydrolipoamide acetyltransferase)